MVSVLPLLVSCLPLLPARRPPPPRKSSSFGIDVAQRGLWSEARFRFERAVELDPDNAQALNNLAVALEQQGDFDKAREAYEKALKLKPGNVYIQQNYDLFREADDKRNRKAKKKTSTPTRLRPQHLRPLHSLGLVRAAGAGVRAARASSRFRSRRPLQSKLDVIALPARAGRRLRHRARADNDVDVSSETARLLQNQLRSSTQAAGARARPSAPATTPSTRSSTKLGEGGNA